MPRLSFGYRGLSSNFLWPKSSHKQTWVVNQKAQDTLLTIRGEWKKECTISLLSITLSVLLVCSRFRFSNARHLQCVHMYRSGMNKVGIFIFDRFFKKRTEAWKMGGFVYFGVCFWFLKKPTKIKMVFMEISWFLTFFWVKTAKNRQKTAFFARKTNFFQFS